MTFGAGADVDLTLVILRACPDRDAVESALWRGRETTEGPNEWVAPFLRVTWHSTSKTLPHRMNSGRARPYMLLYDDDIMQGVDGTGHPEQS